MRRMKRPQKHHMPDFVSSAAIIFTLAAIITYIFFDTKEDPDNED